MVAAGGGDGLGWVLGHGLRSSGPLPRRRQFEQVITRGSLRARIARTDTRIVTCDARTVAACERAPSAVRPRRNEESAAPPRAALAHSLAGASGQELDRRSGDGREDRPRGVARDQSPIPSPIPGQGRVEGRGGARLVDGVDRTPRRSDPGHASGDELADRHSKGEEPAEAGGGIVVARGKHMSLSLEPGRQPERRREVVPAARRRIGEIEGGACFPCGSFMRSLHDSIYNAYVDDMR